MVWNSWSSTEKRVDLVPSMIKSRCWAFPTAALWMGRLNSVGGGRGVSVFISGSHDGFERERESTGRSGIVNL